MQYAFDGLGRLANVVEDPNGLKQLTTYTYTLLDTLASVSQGGQTRSFACDSRGALVQAVNPESGAMTYSYDNAGNLLRRTDGGGKTTTYKYDVLNRPTSIGYSDSTPAVKITYDNL